MTLAKKQKNCHFSFFDDRLNIMRKYRNPILLCDYSDPDVIRVGKTFYMTASSFNFVPGLPLLKSQNLVDWTLVNYAAKKIELPFYEDVQNAKGIWAPSLRFHNGLFYIFFATPDEGIFETHAEDFEGEWSHWNCVWSGKGFIDPCPVWLDENNDDENKKSGKIYVVHGYAKSRIGFNSKLGILELDENLKAVAEDKIIFDGTKTQPTIEGPKIYKRGGFFYIFAPAGGVTNGWQTVLRSKNIFGPYEEKIVLAQGKTKVNGPHQGGYVETENGEGYFLHFQDAGIYGRITHLQPVKWAEDWPLMGSAAVENKSSLQTENSPSLRAERSNLTEKANKTGEPLEEYFVPFDGDSKDEEAHEDGAFRVKSGISEFQFSGNAGIDSLSSSEAGSSSSLRTDAFSSLRAKRSNLGEGTLWLNPYVCTKKITAEKFEYEKEILLSCFSPSLQAASSSSSGTDPSSSLRAQRSNLISDKAEKRHGIIFLGNEYSALEVEKRADGFYLSQIVSSGSEKGDDTRKENTVFEEKLAPGVKSVLLKMKFEESAENARLGKIIFSCRTQGSHEEIEFESSPFQTENAHWVGGRFGFF